MRAQVFTQLREMHELILKEAPARLAGFSVLQFTGSTAPNKRHDVIRSFQEAGGRAQTRGVTGLATISGFRVLAPSA